MNHKVMDQPLISVVMATYNGEEFIADAMQSILNQTFTDFEFIIVDDGSTDSTVSIIDSYNDPRIVYIKKEVNTGIADSLNIGIKKAKGTYIARMDDDDISLPDRFEKQLRILEADKEVILCATSVYGNNSKVYHVPETHEHIKTCLLFYNPIFHPTVMLKREIVVNNAYNSNMVPAEDYDLWSRLIFKGKFQMINEPLLYFSGRPNSETGRRRKEQLLLNIQIATFVYNCIGLNKFEGFPRSLANLVSHNYTIKAKELKKIILWVNNLKLKNEQAKWFEADYFNKIIDNRLNSFVISYFTNNNRPKKLISFFYLDLHFKKRIMIYYFNNILNI